MTLDIALVLSILVVSFALFVSERLRMDLVALLVLATLALSGLVTPSEALAGFSNPAVVTVWAMFILSAGLTATGMAEALGRRLLGLSRRGESTAVAIVMLTGGVLSAFMNNIGVAALMLPVVMSIARRTGTSPSRLLMPLAYGTLLGGLTTLIGTPPNLLASDALREAGYAPFRMFDYVPVGGSVLLVGSVFVVLVGRRWLPQRDPGRETATQDGGELRRMYDVDRRSVVLRLPPRSELDGRLLKDSRLGAATGLNVYAIIRNGEIDVAPNPNYVLRDGDRLLVHGRLDRFEELRAWRELLVLDRRVDLSDIVSDAVDLCRVKLLPGSDLVGMSIGRADLRRRLDLVVLAVRRSTDVVRGDLVDTTLAEGDELLVQGRLATLARLSDLPDFEVLEALPADVLSQRYGLHERLYAVRVPADSLLRGSSLAASRLGDALGFGVLAMVRGERTVALPGPDEALQAGDELLVRGDPSVLKVFRGLQHLEIEAEKSSVDPWVGLDMHWVELTPSPRSGLAGRTLAEIRFRDRYGLRVLALLRAGRVRHSVRGDTRFKFGDALLCLGPRERVAQVRPDPDFLVLNLESQEPVRRGKAPASAAIMAAVVASVLLGFLPISVAAVSGAALTVLTGCLSMEQAYRAIDWRSVFLIAGMLPLGTAMQTSGAASFLAQGVAGALGPLGPWGVLAGLYVVTALLTMVIPTAALVVLVAPIVLDTAARMGLSEHALMMAIAMAASASFTSPVSHPANILVMGPGGYRFVDYVRLGVPLTLVVMVVVLLVLPLVWPLKA